MSLSAPCGRTVTVQWNTTAAGGFPATPDVDYVAVPPTTLSFAPGETSRQVTVQVISDTLDENDERFVVTLSGVVSN